MKKDLIQYKGYLAELSFDLEDNIIVGKVVNTPDSISFHGVTLIEAEKAFHEVLDSYLDACECNKIEPSHPYSGRLGLRIDPALHKALNVAAYKANKTVKGYIEELLTQKLSNNLPIDFKDTEKKLARDKEVIKNYYDLKPKFKDDLIKSLIKARIDSGLSKTELARRIGAFPPSITRFETGNYLPSLNTLLKYAEATGTTLVINLVNPKENPL